MPNPADDSEARGRLRVLIVDDSPEFGTALQNFLRQLGSVDVVGVAMSAEQGLIEAACAMPDVVLMDMVLPGLSGTEATRQIKRWPHPPRVIMLSASEQAVLEHAAKTAGADACVEKRSIASHLSKALGLCTAA